MRKILGLALIVLLVGGIAFFWSGRRGAPPGPDGSSSATDLAPASVIPASSQAAAEPGRCDPATPLAPLPATFTPAATDLPGLVRALDDTLTGDRKAWIRCFTLDDELLAKTHQGFGRWLRTTLQLSRQPALVKALGARYPDEASSIITLAYAYHLRGQELSPAEAKARRDQALADAGVRP